jgi:hypothetical protein
VTLRYVVSELEGWPIVLPVGQRGGGVGKGPGLFVAVHDSVYCYRVVESFATERLGHNVKTADRRRVVRKRARDLARKLNGATA